MPRLARSEQRTWEPHRDAALVDLTFGCGLRPKEARGERWWQVLWPTDDAAGVLRVREVIAAGQVAEGKTVGSYRDAPLPRLIAERLREWRDVASAHGLPTGPQDFVIPGLAPKIGKREPGGHMTANQEKKWGGKYLKPACAAVAAAYPERAYLTDATAYAGRRGHISSRLAAGKSPQPSPAIAARHARRSSATTRRIWVRTSTGPTRHSTSSLHARRRRWRVCGSLGRLRPRRCTATPAIMIGSARGRREPSHALAQRIAARARTWTSASGYLAAARSPRWFGAARPRDRCFVRAARASRRYPSRRSNLAGVCRICVDHRERALQEAPGAANRLQNALLAQLVEHFHGKGLRVSAAERRKGRI
jgi:hypothetical protein